MKTDAELLAFIKEAKENKWCIPPVHEIRFAHHYWVQDNPQASGSADMPQLRVVQWSPSTCTWYHSDDLATDAKPLNYILYAERGYHLIGRAWLPPLTEEARILTDTMALEIDQREVYLKDKLSRNVVIPTAMRLMPAEQREEMRQFIAHEIRLAMQQEHNLNGALERAAVAEERATMIMQHIADPQKTDHAIAIADDTIKSISKRLLPL